MDNFFNILFGSPTKETENNTDDSLKNILGSCVNLDLSKKEDLDKFVNTANEIKETSKGLGNILGYDWNEIIDGLIDDAKALNKKYNSEKKDYTEPKKSECSCCKKEVIDNTINENYDVLPSEFTSENHKNQIHKLVSEYICKYVARYSNDKKVLDDYAEALFEFACWMMNK